MNPDNVPTQKKKWSRVRRLLLIAGGVLVLFFVICGIVLFAADSRVERCAAGRVYSEVEAVPAREYGLVPGTSRLVHGKHLNTYFTNRIRAALSLYRAGKIRKIIVSGDNGRTDYNETGDMTRASASRAASFSRIDRGATSSASNPTASMPFRAAK